MAMLVHKAVEPDNLSKAGKKRFAELVLDLQQGGNRAVVLPKYDGVYAQLVPAEKRLAWTAWSRTGQPLASVSPELLEDFAMNAIHGRHYVGELWLPSTAHQKINGLSRKQSPQHLMLRLFDSFDLRQPEETFEQRYEYLFHGKLVEPAPILPTVGKINVIDDLYDMALALKNRGASAYDGLILRDNDGLYVPGKGTDGESIKIKPRAEGDFRVLGTTAGQGNREGGIGALVVSLGAGVSCEVGTGLTQKEVFGPDPTGWIATVEYLGITKDGKLREPSFKVFRHDKTEADTLTQETED